MNLVHRPVRDKRRNLRSQGQKDLELSISRRSAW